MDYLRRALMLAFFAACPGDDGSAPQADSGATTGVVSTTSAADTTGPIVVEYSSYAYPGGMKSVEIYVP